MVRRPFRVGVRHSSCWLRAALVALPLLHPQPASAQPPSGPFCDGTTTENCIIDNTFTVNSLPRTANITAMLRADPATGIYSILLMNTNNPSDQFELASAVDGLTTASEVSLTFRMSNSAADPRSAVSTGLISSWIVNTGPNPNEVTITARPRASSWARETPMGTDDEPPGGCTGPPPSGFCENTADVDYQALLLAAFDPMTPPPGAPAEFVNFMNAYTTGYMSTNAQFFSPLPSYNPSTEAISFFVGSPHFTLAGPVNTGFVRMFIPEAVITDPTLWNISGGSAALAANNSMTTVTVGGTPADFDVDAVTSGGTALGALVKVGELNPFSYSVPEVVVKPTAASGPPAFTDATLTTGSSEVRAVHFMELRSRIDAIRVARGLPAYEWTDSPLVQFSTVIRAVHITEMRAALAQAYSASGLTPPTYTDPTLDGTFQIKAVHIAELRAAVITIE
jgi:hypothetical protein